MMFTPLIQSYNFGQLLQAVILEKRKRNIGRITIGGGDPLGDPDLDPGERKRRGNVPDLDPDPDLDLGPEPGQDLAIKGIHFSNIIKILILKVI